MPFKINLDADAMLLLYELVQQLSATFSKCAGFQEMEAQCIADTIEIAKNKTYFFAFHSLSSWNTMKPEIYKVNCAQNHALTIPVHQHGG